MNENSFNKEDFERTGVCHCPDFLPANALSRIESTIENLEGACHSREALHVYYENPLDHNSDIRLIENLCSVSPEMYDLATDLSKELEDLIFEPVVLFKDKIVLKPAGGQGYAAHRDGQFWWYSPDGEKLPGWNAYAKEFYSMVLFLDDATMENGCLEFAVGEHRSVSEISDFEYLARETFDHLDFAPLPVKAGDLVIFNTMVPHQSGKNNTSSPRRALYFTYNPAAEGDSRIQYFSDKRTSVLAQGKTGYYR